MPRALDNHGHAHAGARPGRPHDAARRRRMRPTLNVISPELCARAIAEAKRIMAESGMEIRGPAMRQRLLDHGPEDHAADGTRILFPPEVVERAIATAPKSFTLYDRDGAAARRARRRQRALRAGLERTQDPRPPHRRDAADQFHRLRRVRAALRRPRAHRLPRDCVLDQQGHRVAGLRRVAPVHAAHDVEEADGLRRVHRARRAAHARHDAAVPTRPRRTGREADVDLHDHGDGQFPLQRRLVPEPARLRRGRHPGRDRAR